MVRRLFHDLRFRGFFVLPFAPLAEDDDDGHNQADSGQTAYYTAHDRANIAFRLSGRGFPILLPSGPTDRDRLVRNAVREDSR